MPDIKAGSYIYFSDIFQWRYCVRLENFSDKAVQVVDKQLSVFSTSGTLDRLRVRSLIEQVGTIHSEETFLHKASNSKGSFEHLLIFNTGGIKSIFMNYS